MFVQPLQHLTHVLYVTILVVREDKDIVDVRAAELVQVPLQRPVNVALEGCGPISQTKRQDLILVRAIPCTEGSKRPSLSYETDTVECLSDI